MKLVNPNSRLRAIAGLIPAGAKLADIGTDHGYLPIYCVQNRITASCIASDIRPGPLASAVHHAEEFGVADRIRFCCAPGLDAVKPGEADTVVIAGMGGETMQTILEKAEWLQAPGVFLILQPQSKILELQAYLTGAGFALQSAALAEDGGRLYPIWCLRWSEKNTAKHGPYYLAALSQEPYFPQYCAELMKKLEIRLAGLALSENSREEAETIRIIYEYIKGFGNDYGKTDF